MSRRSSRGRSPRRKQSSSGALILWGIVAVGVLAVIVAVAQSGGNDSDEAEIKPGPSSSADTGTNPANDFDKLGSASNGSLEPNFRALAKKVDMSAWTEAEKHYREARRLKAEAMAIRPKSEAQFKKIMGKAIEEWRQGNALYDDWKYEVDGLHEDLIDKAFRKQDRLVTKLQKEFRGWLKFEKN